MRSILIVTAVTVLSIFFAVGLSQTQAQQSAAAVGPMWEYKVVVLDTLLKDVGINELGAAMEKRLDALGGEGFELCQTATNGIFILKREKR